MTGRNPTLKKPSALDAGSPPRTATDATMEDKFQTLVHLVRELQFKDEERRAEDEERKVKFEERQTKMEEQMNSIIALLTRLATNPNIAGAGTEAACSTAAAATTDAATASGTTLVPIDLILAFSHRVSPRTFRADPCDDPRRWLHACENNFSDYRLPRATWVREASRHMAEGPPASFARAQELKDLSWEEWSDALCEEFDSADIREDLDRQFRGQQQGTGEAASTFLAGKCALHRRLHGCDPPPDFLAYLTTLLSAEARVPLQCPLPQTWTELYQRAKRLPKRQKARPAQEQSMTPQRAQQLAQQPPQQWPKQWSQRPQQKRSQQQRQRSKPPQQTSSVQVQYEGYE